ncbi:MAG: sn-glycerol-3-phosphate ABC transporter ATP-binding protein UgpC [Clostridiales bacterium]|jgi:multiple sugar transport system ATP-binding protein|nr:sn-glycerol-3-phosphate ABC transporter ATP-binding protein UgpC [Clostridiales bacterium]
MASVHLENVSKVFPNGVKAVSDFTLGINDKEFIVLVGPSGCGKSTTLRMIAGLEDISNGELYIDGRLVNDVVPKDRDIAMVFQNYALYPHMTVYDNMAFGLKLRKMPKAEIDARVKEAARILGIEQLLSRKPKALSGGQKQRVALGRAIVREPKVFLLDEPLSNLDAKLRAQMRTEITKLHNRLATTFIYVTHDQVEAMTMGTRIVVMKDGYIQQVDSPQNLYDYPVNQFVASFIGTPQMNFFDAHLELVNGKVNVVFENNRIVLPEAKSAKIIDLAKLVEEKTPVMLGVRPEDIHDEEVFIANSPDTIVECKVEVVEKLGSETLLYCNLDLSSQSSDKIVDETSTTMVARVDARTKVQRDEVVKLAFDALHIHLFLKSNQMSLLKRDDEFNGSNVPGILEEECVRIGNKKLPVKLSSAAKDNFLGSEVLVYVENDAVSVNAKGKDAIEASVANVEQIGFKKYLTLNLNYTEDENADKTPKTVFVNVPTNMDIEEGAVLKVALNRYKVLSAETREVFFESEK